MTHRAASLFLLLAGCGQSGPVAENANGATPALAVTSETPGDWSNLELMIGRTPADSGLLQESPITVDLNALVGPQLDLFRLRMGDSTQLRGEGGVLVSLARSGDAYLVIDPADHALEAGLKASDGWRTFTTSGAEVARPASVARLRGG